MIFLILPSGPSQQQLQLPQQAALHLLMGISVQMEHTQALGKLDAIPSVQVACTFLRDNSAPTVQPQPAPNQHQPPTGQPSLLSSLRMNSKTSLLSVSQKDTSQELPLFWKMIPTILQTYPRINLKLLSNSAKQISFNSASQPRLC